jgi:hypothetical protein
MVLQYVVLLIKDAAENFLNCSSSNYALSIQVIFKQTQTGVTAL